MANRNMKSIPACILAACCSLCFANAQEPAAGKIEDIELWTVDPLVHVLENAPPCPAAPAEIEILAARGEWENGQFAMRTKNAVPGLKLSVTPLTGPDGAKLERVSIHPIGRVRIPCNTAQTAPQDLIVKAPANIPDVLLDTTEFDFKSGYTQPVWIKAWVPREAAAGDYKGAVVLEAGGAKREIPVAAHVYGAVIPSKCHVDVTHWATFTWLPNQAKDAGEEGMDEFRKRMFEDMAEHRQNTITIGTFSTAALYDSGDPPIMLKENEKGELSLDFTRFDKYAQMAFDAGIERLTLGHLCSRRGGWNGPEIVSWGMPVYGADGKKKREIPEYDSADPEFRKIFLDILPKLYRHLEEKGWRERVLIQHLADEPLPNTVPAYNRAVAVMKEAVPGLVIGDASRTRGIAGGAWIPSLSLYDSDLDFYKQTEAEGGVVWQYTCDNPRGKYPNFFPDYELIRARMVNWANWRYAITGYLNWNYNCSQGQVNADPGEVGSAPDPNSAEFCSYVVSAPGDKPLPSVRFAALRDGREDFELLRIVALRDTDKSRALAKKQMADLRNYVRDPAAFRAIRKELLDAASVAAKEIPVEELESGKIVWDYAHEPALAAMPPADRPDYWKLAYAPELVDGQLPNDWKAVSGDWKIENGWLVGTTPIDPESKQRIRDWSKEVVCLLPFEGDVRLEYDCRSDVEGRPCDLTAILNCNEKGFMSGYFFGFGSDDNAFSKILVEGSEIIIREAQTIRNGKVHRVVVQRDNGVLSQFIDGELAMFSADLMPLKGPEHRNIGFYLWTDGKIGNIKVYTK